MLVHLVCWKYKPEISAAVRNEHIKRLDALRDHIPEVLKLIAGADVLGLERSFDTGLAAYFRDRAALDAYTNHPEHLEVAEMGRKIAERVVSVDFLTGEDNL